MVFNKFICKASVFGRIKKMPIVTSCLIWYVSVKRLSICKAHYLSSLLSLATMSFPLPNYLKSSCRLSISTDNRYLEQLLIYFLCQCKASLKWHLVSKMWITLPFMKRWNWYHIKSRNLFDHIQQINTI